MLKAFKDTTGSIYPFAHITSAYKVHATSIAFRILHSEHTPSIFFDSEKERNTQFANFEKWLTTTPNLL